jgi:glucose/arabinose dehydrogenase
MRKLSALLLALVTASFLLVCCNEADSAPPTKKGKPNDAAKVVASSTLKGTSNSKVTPIRNGRGLPLHNVKLPPGFAIELYADNVPSARELCLSDSGVLFIGSNAAGKVYAAVDSDGDVHADEVITLASGLHLPVGVALHGGDLYYSEVERVSRITDVERDLRRPAAAVKVTDFPDREHHGWKFIAFGPDGMLYVPVGVPCNVCDEGDPFGAILRFDVSTGGDAGATRQVVARGMRNTVGFDWHPVTGELWWTDNGRDSMGDNVPPDELNFIPKGSGVDAAAPHFGFPFWHGGTVKDPEYGGQGKAASAYVKPVQNLGPHVAALGMEFYEGGMFPAEYQHQVFIAEHGSWNRSAKIGYRVMLVKTDGKVSQGYSVFAEGWRQGENVWGRPADVEVMRDGSLLVSDDFAGCVYRIFYAGK